MQSTRRDARASGNRPGKHRPAGERSLHRQWLAVGLVLAAGLAAARPAMASVAFHGLGRMVPALLEKRAGEAELRFPADRPKLIRVQAGGTFAVADIVGEPGRPIPIGVDMPPFEPTDYVLLSFRRLPKGFSLSSGFRTAEAWLVSAHDVAGLKLVPPDGFSGEFSLEVQLIRGQNVEPLIKRVRVSVLPKRAARNEPSVRAPSASIPTAAVPEQATASVANTTPIDPEQEKQLLGRAKSMLELNDISAARLIYARLARKGSVQGALTLAQTYDPAFLSQYDVAGLQPNKQKAKYWYGIAASLGSDDASGRLLALEAAGAQ